jgi:hypothetical protein
VPNQFRYPTHHHDLLLKGTDVELYATNEFFRTQVDFLIGMLPSFVDGLADSSKIAAEQQRQAVSRVRLGIAMPLPQERLPFIGVEPARYRSNVVEKRCECDEPKFSDDPKPIEAWWRCGRCHGMLWMGSDREPDEDMPFRYQNIGEWIKDHPDAEEVPLEYRVDGLQVGYLPGTATRYNVTRSGKIRRGPIGDNP